MSYVITVKKLEIFAVTFPDRSVVELRQVGDEWNGMRELTAPTGQKLIAMRKDAPNVLSELFGGMFRMEDREWIVLAASPDLLARMKSKAE